MPSGDERCEVHPLDVLHHHRIATVHLHDLHHLQDVVVLQQSQEPRLVAHASHEVFGAGMLPLQHLDRHLTAEAPVRDQIGKVDGAKSPCADHTLKM